MTEVLASDEPGVPATIRDLVLARLTALTPAAQQIVRFVSVIPTRTELWVLKQALGPAPAAVEDSVANGLLVADGDAVGFRHELIRQAVEQSLSALRHEELNRLALRVLSGRHGVDLARLAHHARQSGDGAAVVHYAPKAAQEAETAGAHRQALEHYRAALRHADDLPGPQRADLLEGCSFNAYLTGHTDEALSTRVAALRIREAAGQIRQVGRNLCWLSRLRWWAGRHDEAETAAARAIAVLEPAGASRELAMAYSNRAQLDVLAREMTSAIEWSSRAIVLAEQVGDRETVAHALTSIGTARQGLGDRAGRAELERAIEIAMCGNLPHHTSRAMANLAITTMELGDIAQALQDLDRALSFARARELVTYALYLLGHRALWRLNLGDWTGAETDARDVLAQTGQPAISEVPALIALGRLQARRGEADATCTLREATRVVLTTGEPQRVAPVVAVRAEHAWLCGQPDRAVTEAARAAFELVRRTRHPWFAGELAWWLHRAGQQPDIPEWVAEPYRLLLNGHWDDAAVEWGRRGYPYEQAEALACSDREDAHRQALEIFDRLGAVPAATRLRLRLRAQGRRVPRGPRAATAANPAHLTARQMEVLTQLATGGSNAVIARRLSLSVRTVDHHVASVLAKLSAPSRDDAVATARRLGIIPAQDGLSHTAS